MADNEKGKKPTKPVTPDPQPSQATSPKNIPEIEDANVLQTLVYTLENGMNMAKDLKAFPTVGRAEPIRRGEDLEKANAYGHLYDLRTERSLPTITLTTPDSGEVDGKKQHTRNGENFYRILAACQGTLITMSRYATTQNEDNEVIQQFGERTRGDKFPIHEGHLYIIEFPTERDMQNAGDLMQGKNEKGVKVPGLGFAELWEGRKIIGANKAYQRLNTFYGKKLGSQEAGTADWNPRWESLMKRIMEIKQLGGSPHEAAKVTKLCLLPGGEEFEFYPSGATITEVTEAPEEKYPFERLAKRVIIIADRPRPNGLTVNRTKTPPGESTTESKSSITALGTPITGADTETDDSPFG